jgi:hypothetical protein
MSMHIDIKRIKSVTDALDVVALLACFWHCLLG